MCQCPLSGYLHFYMVIKKATFNSAICVNALYRAISISTRTDKSLTEMEDYVSMPFIGLSPFLRSTLWARINRGHNSETIQVIVRQFRFASSLTSFFPSFDRFTLFIIHVFYYRLKLFFFPAVLQGIPFIFHITKGTLTDAFILLPVYHLPNTSCVSFKSFLHWYFLVIFIS